MKILVTGGAGFIGSHIVDACIDAGHDVFVIDNLSSGVKEFVHPKAKLYETDICSHEMRALFEQERPEIIFHHAAQIDVRRSVTDPMFDANVNIVGSLNLFECARNVGTKKIVFASTGGAIYGEQDYFPADERHPTRPLSPYGITKMCVENYLRFYKDVYGIDYVVLRYANVYGPRQNPHGEAGVIAIFADRLLNGKIPVINGDGSQTRDFVFVGDVVRANMKAMSFGSSDFFNVGTGKETDINSVFSHLRRWLNPTVTATHGTAKPGEQKRSVISYGKIKEKLGWEPTQSIEEGIRITSDFFKKRKKN